MGGWGRATLTECICYLIANFFLHENPPFDEGQIFPDQGSVVQSIVSLMKSLVKDSFSLLVGIKSSMLIFFAEKNCMELHKFLAKTKNGTVFTCNVFEILASL